MRVKRSIGRALAPERPGEAPGELVEAALRDLGHERVAAAEVAVEGGRRHPDELGGVGQREAAEPALGDEAPRGLDQRLLQIPVVIAPPSPGRSQCRIRSTQPA
jgi:hypothetical protein